MIPRKLGFIWGSMSPSKKKKCKWTQTETQFKDNHTGGLSRTALKRCTLLISVDAQKRRLEEGEKRHAI